MPLKNIQDKLYSPNTEIEDRPHEFDELDPRNNPVQKPADDPRKPSDWQEKNNGETTQKQKKLALKIGLGFLILLTCLGLAYGLYIYLMSGFSKDNFILTFDNPEKVEAIQEFPIELIYHNNNRKPLKNCVLTLNHPESLEITNSETAPDDAALNFMSFNIPELEKQASGTFNFRAKVTNQSQGTTYLKATLVCELKESKKETIKESQTDIQVESAPILLDLSATRQATSGDVVEYLATIKNNTTGNLNGVEAILQYPAGFTFATANIAAANEENNSFKFATLAPQESLELRITGSLAGAANEKKVVFLKVGTNADNQFKLIAEESAQTEMTSSPLSIAQKVKSNQGSQNAASINPGEDIEFTVTYKNNSDLPLRDAVITTQLAGDAANYNNIKVFNSGHFDAASHTITWRPGTLQELALLNPQAEGSVSFTLPVLSILPSRKDTDKNFEISSTAQIDSPDIPTPIGSNKVISSSKISIKVKSKVLFDVSAFYNDNLVENQGPLPPRVGQETNYTIHFKITNINNDIENTQVKATLPEYVLWLNNIFPAKSAELTFDERTREITWTPGAVPAQSGTSLPAKEIAFQVSLVPTESQINQSPVIINEATLTAKDSFIQESITKKDKAITTNLPDDISVGIKEKTVSP